MIHSPYLESRIGVEVLPSFKELKNESLTKIKEMKITNHFRKRTLERTPYNDCESLLYDMNLHRESIVPLTNNSNQLRWYPWLKKELRKFPNTWILMLECLNLAIITDGMNLVTVYELNT